MALIVLSACASDGETDRWDSLMDGVSTNQALSDKAMSRTRVVKNDGRDLVNTGFNVPGSGTFVNSADAALSQAVESVGRDGYTLNLVGAPIDQAEK